jgi:hypothetical protein
MGRNSTVSHNQKFTGAGTLSLPNIEIKNKKYEDQHF